MRKVLLTPMQEKGLIVQSNKLVEARYSLSIHEQRIVLMMLSMIKKEDKDFFIYKISINDFVKITGLKNKNIYRKIKETLISLDSKRFTIEKEDGYLTTGWTSDIEYKGEDGVIEISFSPKLKPYLLDLKNKFTSYQLNTVIQFKTSMSIRIYTLLKQYEKFGERTFEIGTFKEILDLKEGAYPIYQDFKKRIILPTQKELNKKSKNGSYISDIGFEFEQIKTGRKITSLKFIIIQHKVNNSENEIQSDGFDIKQKYLKAYNVSPSMVEELAKNHTKGEIEKCIDIFESRKKAGQVKVDGSGLLISLIKNGAGLPSIDEKKAQEKIEQEQQEVIEKEKEKLSLEYSKIAKQEFFDSLSQEAEQRILDQLLRQYEGQVFYIERLKKDGIKSTVLGGDIIDLIPKYEQKKKTYISKKIKEKYPSLTS